MTRLLNMIPVTDSIVPRGSLLHGFFDYWPMPSLFADEKAWSPAFDVTEKENAYVVTAELPGIDVKDLEVTLTDGILTVKGEKKQEKEEKGENHHRIERVYGTFHRSFRIPGRVESDKVDANYKDGILTLTLPKEEESKPTKIEVN
jgi:HSP20 family protein